MRQLNALRETIVLRRLLLRWLFLGWLLVRWLLVRWLLLGWLILGWLFLGENGCLGNPYFLLTGCLGIEFFDSPFPNTVSYATFGYLPLTVQHLCDLWDAMPLQWSPGASHPTLTLGSRGVAHEWQAF